jgi:hypothetical protein
MRIMMILLNKSLASTFMLLSSLLFIFDSSYSQEIEPRAYSNLPEGSNFAVLNYSYTNGNIVSDPAAPIKELELSANNIVSGYMRTFSLFGKLARLQLTIPYTFLSGNAKLAGKDTAGTRAGLSDSRIRFGINFIGSPALNIKEYMKYKDETIVGASLVISIPTGQYFEDRLINLGTNRWGFKPELGISRRFGNFYSELYAGVWFYTANTEYLKTNEVTTDPLFAAQSHFNYVFPNTMWLGISLGYASGGETNVNGVPSDTKQDNWRLGATFSSPLTRQLSLKLQYHAGAVVRRGSDFDMYSATLQYFWL